MARSVLDTFADGDASSGVESLLVWASDMMELYAESARVIERGGSLEDSVENHPEGIVAWFFALEEMRKRAHEDEMAGNLVSDAEVKRMAELDRLAAMGTEDEQLLHSLICRHDHVQHELDILHKRCGALCSVGSGISREVLEELYLYLKEKVASGLDLETLSDEMHEHVYGRISSHKVGNEIRLQRTNSEMKY